MAPLRQQIKSGRAADIDQAVVFLDRLALWSIDAEDDSEAPQAETQPDATPKQAPQTPEDADALLSDVSEKIERAKEGAGDDATADLLSDAVDLLQDQAIRMLDDLDQSGGLEADAVLRSCTDAMASLFDLLNTAKSDDPALRELRDDVQEGEEMLMLFQLERGDEAALDAATLLLQIRKELIEKTAV
ncbi:hypothetical protein N4R57_16475 [Rhodobacteraceae bacterium D3-12]|nr:hypothetical protein N4R57_16475 [Rhodobacteraceae bacterium D3-12]